MILSLCTTKLLLLDPLRLVISAEGNPSEQDGLVKLHAHVVPERPERIPILETEQKRESRLH